MSRIASLLVAALMPLPLPLLVLLLILRVPVARHVAVATVRVVDHVGPCPG